MHDRTVAVPCCPTSAQTPDDTFIEVNSQLHEFFTTRSSRRARHAATSPAGDLEASSTSGAPRHERGRPSPEEEHSLQVTTPAALHPEIHGKLPTGAPDSLSPPAPLPSPPSTIIMW